MEEGDSDSDISGKGWDSDSDMSGDSDSEMSGDGGDSDSDMSGH